MFSAMNTLGKFCLRSDKASSNSPRGTTCVSRAWMSKGTDAGEGSGLEATTAEHGAWLSSMWMVVWEPPSPTGESQPAIVFTLPPTPV